MSWLLKIVDGPLKGAEIALLGGRRTSVGSDDACDLVIADQSLAAKAFELDVSETAVTLLVEGGEAKVIRPFEVHTFGTTSIAVGPAEDAWQPLTRPDAAPTQPSAPETAPQEKAESSEAVTPPVAEDGDGTEKRRYGLGCLVWLVLVLLLGLAVWWFWPRIVDKCPQAERGRTVAVAQVKSWSASAWAWVREKAGKKPEPVIVKGPSLAEIAEQYGLALTPAAAEGERATLAGNVRLRTERLAIRALALADDPTVKFDLTDDETLRTSANELLFVVTEGALKAVAASNRVVTLTGYAPTAAKLEMAVRALAKDVASVERLDTTQVRVGGTPPKDVAQSAFADARSTSKPAAAVPKAAARPDYPIAGILTKPYPCIVMRNGLRLTEGAQIGAAVLEKIAADKLILREGKTTFEWRP